VDIYIGEAKGEYNSQLLEKLNNVLWTEESPLALQLFKIYNQTFVYSSIAKDRPELIRVSSHLQLLQIKWFS